MRVFLLLASASMLASCGGAGGGVSSLGSSSVGTPIAGATPTPTATGTPTATPTPGATATPTATPTPGVTGSSSTASAPAATPVGTSMFDVTSAVTFKAVGAVNSLKRNTTTGATTYAGNAATVAQPTGTITYDPRDAIFVLSFQDEKAGVARTIRFQDPVHRTDFVTERTPDPSVINLTNYNYLVSALDDSSTGFASFFYLRPGNQANYVTLAGYVVHNPASSPTVDERGAMVFGAPTPLSQLPRTGGGSYAGEFLATMVAKNADDPNAGATRHQWIDGKSAVTVDFAQFTVGLSLNGTVRAAVDDTGKTVADSQLLIPSGSTFTASGTSKLDLATGSFAGKFDSAAFSTVNGNAPQVDFAAISAGSSTAGASSIDGSFYGPNAIEVGGNFRIVGGKPDQRVDILGGFVGRKKP